MRKLFIAITTIFFASFALADSHEKSPSLFDIGKIFENIAEDVKDISENPENTEAWSQAIKKLIGKDSYDSNLDDYGTEEQKIRFLRGQEVLLLGDYEKAFALWYPLAEKGYAPAEAGIGRLYTFEEGFPRNYEKGLKWFKKAANAGMAVAQNNVGWIYENGKEVKVNVKKAMRYYRKSAEQNYPTAQFNIGELYNESITYNKGNGVEKSNLNAYKWYSIADGNHLKEAKARLAELDEKMTSEDIDTAKKIARICVISKFKDCD